MWDSRTVAETLYEHGFTAYPHSHADLLIEDGTDRIFVEVKRLQRAPRPAQIEHARKKNPDHAQLYVVPSITPSVMRLGVQYPFIAFIGMSDNDLVWKSERRTLHVAPLNPGQRGRQSWARWAVMRALLAPVAPMNQVQLADSVGASQASVSNALKWLEHRVVRTGDGWHAADPEKLWQLCLDTYPGVGVAHTHTHWLSLEPPVQQSQRVIDAISDECPEARVLCSGDVGADLIAAWRVPNRAVVYSDCAVNPERLGFAPAKSRESTLDFVMPHDPTIWHTAKLFSPAAAADPVIVASELMQNPGADVNEALQQLKQRTLAHLREARQ